MTEVSKIEKNLDPDIYKHLKSLLYKQSALATKQSEDPEYKQTPCPAGPHPVFFAEETLCSLVGVLAASNPMSLAAVSFGQRCIQRRNLELQVGYGLHVVPSKPISVNVAAEPAQLMSLHSR
jgi:hypothetical protein